MKMYFIRHTSVAVPVGTCYGQSDVAVKNTFPEEAASVLAQINFISFDYVYCSPLSRCVKLADFCGYSQAILDSRLKELDFGAWELQRWEEINDPHLQIWYKDWINTRVTGGESFHDLYQRFTDFINEIPKANTIAIFTHGGIINCARVYTGLTTQQQMFVQTPSYGSVTLIEMN